MFGTLKSGLREETIAEFRQLWLGWQATASARYFELLNRAQQRISPNSFSSAWIDFSKGYGDKANASCAAAQDHFPAATRKPEALSRAELQPILGYLYSELGLYPANQFAFDRALKPVEAGVHLTQADSLLEAWVEHLTGTFRRALMALN